MKKQILSLVILLVSIVNISADVGDSGFPECGMGSMMYGG
jgi:hypothetical protein